MTKTTDFVRSLTRLGWSLSVLGAEQASQALSSLGVDGEARAARVFDRVSEAAEAGMSASAREVFRGVDRFQARLVDLLFGAGDPLAEAGRGMARRALVTGGARVARRALEALAPSLDEGLRRRAAELINELESFELFADPQGALGLRPDCCSDRLPGCLAKARQEDPWRAAWLIEGIGFLRAERAWIADDAAQANTASTNTASTNTASTNTASASTTPSLDEARLPPPADLEPSNRLPLHTGMGLSLARRFLPRLRHAEDRPTALGELARLARRNAHPGFALVVFEPLGFVIRLVAPELSTDIDRTLAEAADPDRESLRAAFWHGVGRGMYFAPSHFEPGAWSRAFAEAREIAPDALALVNLLSGHAWAVTLVNLRQPEILEAFLAKATRKLGTGTPAGDELEAVGRGIEAALVVWTAHAPTPGQGAPDEPRLDALRSHAPGADGPASDIREAWHRFVIEGSRRALSTARALEQHPDGEPSWSRIFHLDAPASPAGTEP